MNQGGWDFSSIRNLKQYMVCMVLNQFEPETCGTGAGLCTTVIQNGQCIDCKFWKLSEIVCEIGKELDDQLECDHYVSI